jgi:hypothetical protein
MTIIQRHTSELGRPTIGRTKKAKVVVTDVTETLTDSELAQLVRALEYFTVRQARIAAIDDPTLWEGMAQRFRKATRVRLEVTREVD